MSQEIEPTRRDLEEELTELEYQATQRILEPTEQQRLDSLRQQSQALLADVAARTDLPDNSSTVVDGDDSP